MKSRPITITINGRFVTQPLTGVQRYSWEIVKALDELCEIGGIPGLSVSLLLPKGAVCKHIFKHVRVERSRFLSGHAWEQFELPWRRQGVLLNMGNTFPVLGGKQVVVFHDASVFDAPEGYRSKFVAYYRLMARLAKIKAAFRLVTVSEFSRSRIAHHSKIPEERISIVGCSVDHWNLVAEDDSVLRRLNLKPGKFLLGTGSGNPNKNTSRVIEAFKYSALGDVQLVLVGGAESSIFSGSCVEPDSKVVRTGHVSDSELAALYKNALCFVFPSLYEGFGLPPLEAMYFGCPVVASNTSSLPEVLGIAAEYCDAQVVDDIARAIQNVCRNSQLRGQLIAEGKKQIERFKWTISAKNLISIAMTL